MLNSGVLGLAIGLILVYFLLSLLCSGINELVEAFRRRRATFLEGGIVDLLGLHLKAQLYDHPLLETLYPQKGMPTTQDNPDRQTRRKPSYIPAKTFSQAVLSILTEGSARLTETVDAAVDRLPVDASTGFREGFTIQLHAERMLVTGVEPGIDEGPSVLVVTRGYDGTTAASHDVGARVTRYRGTIPKPEELVAELRESVDALRSGSLREVLGGLLTTVGSDLERWREGIETWFDDKMDRVSGWYGRRTRTWLFVYGIVIVFALNADTALIARTLWNDATLRDAVVAQAQVVAGEGTQEPCGDRACVEERLQAVKALGLPLGWPDLRVTHWHEPAYASDDRVPHSLLEVVLKILGLLLTAGALTLGSAFWFDLLNKVTNFRASGPPPARSTSQNAEAPKATSGPS